jgi:hypothetical protein
MPTMLTLKALLPRLESAKTVWGFRAVALVAMGVPVVSLALLLHYLPVGVYRPEDPGQFWTMIAGVAAVIALGIAIGVGMIAWYGLRSIRLARHDMVVRATRDARSIAIARAEQFSSGILKVAHSAIRDELAAARLEPFTHEMKSGIAIFDEPTMLPLAREWWKAVPGPTRNKIINFLNDLEAWCMYFTKELAEADVVFEPCGATFCSIVMQYSPWIIMARREQYSGFYPNTVALFKAWRSELEVRDRGQTTEVALRAAKAAEARRAQAALPKPLGTKVDI